MHNSFDLHKIGESNYKIVSHNFPEIFASGSNEEEAVKNLDSKIRAYALNNPAHFKKRLREYIAKGLSCGCGNKINSPAIGIYGAV